MRSRLRNPLLITALLLWAAASSATDITPSQVLANTQQLNGQKVSVTGVVSFLKAALSPDGTPYRTFKLCDGDVCLAVASNTKDNYTEGKQITVQGIFWAVWHQGAIARFNELVISN